MPAANPQWRLVPHHGDRPNRGVRAGTGPARSLDMVGARSNGLEDLARSESARARPVDVVGMEAVTGSKTAAVEELPDEVTALRSRAT